MHPRLSPVGRTSGTLLVALVALTAACQEAVEPTGPTVLAAKPGSGPVVNNVVPDSSKRGTRLDITVSGSGFDQGSVVALEQEGVPAAGITVNATTFITPRKLIADVSIAAAADTGHMDVAVTTSGGRKGVGIELFVVQYEIAELGMFGGTWSIAHAINDQGVIVGASCTDDCLSRAFRWTESGGLEDLGTMAGYSRSYAYAITGQGTIFGTVECRPGDPGCGDEFQRQLVRWDMIGDSWTITPVAGCSLVVGPFGFRFLVNDSEQCVAGRVVRTLSGGAVVSEELLPPLVPGGTASAFAISNAPMVAGVATDLAGTRQPVLWYRRSNGTWDVLPLGLPSTDVFAHALDVGEPDAAGRVFVSGYSQMAGTRQPIRALRWTLESDGLGGWGVVSTEIFESPIQQRGQANAWGVGINDAGDMVGIAGGYVESGSPIKWAADGSFEVLPVSTGTAQGIAVAINNNGWIVGSVWDPRNACDRAAVWRQN